MLWRFRLGLSRCLSSVSRYINNSFSTVVFGPRSHDRNRNFWFGTDRVRQLCRQLSANPITRSLFKEVTG